MDTSPMWIKTARQQDSASAGLSDRYRAETVPLSKIFAM
jgi:hypothetical protein